MNKLEAALAWAARGFRVFPCMENSRQPLPGFGSWWLHATANPDVIRSIWQDQISGIVRDYNIGVDTTDLCVVDVDTKHGEHALANFYAMGGHFDTLTVRSQSGGYHVYTEPPHAVANSQGSMAQDVDVRGYHGLVLAPGSTIDGRPYEILRDLPIASTPAGIIALCKPPKDRSSGADASGVEADTPSSIALAQDYLANAAPAVSGQGGNNQTFQVAARARDLGVSEQTCFELMLAHFNERCDPPWSPDELRQIVENAYAYAENPIGFRSPAAIFANVQAIPEPPPAPAPEPDILAADDAEKPAIRFGNVLPLAALRPRPWLYKGLLEREEVTLLVAPGGTGKSLAVLDAAISLALGAPWWGFDNAEGRRIGSVIYNAEDSLNEMSMRLHAACIQRNVAIADVAPYICLISGKSHDRLCLIELRNGTPTVVDAAVKTLFDLCSNPGIGMLALDPMARIHTLNENDNSHMTMLMDLLGRLAARTNTAILMPHHMAKPPMANYAPFVGSASAGRGAGGIVEASRVAVTLASPTDDDCTRFGIPPFRRQRLVRLDDAKLNRGIKRGEPVWLHKETVVLPTREEVGAFQQIDIRDLARDMRMRVATTLYVELSSRHSASMSLAEATSLLMRLDPVWGQVSPAQVRQRLELMLTEAADFGGLARTVRLEVKDTKKLIVMD